MRKTCGVFLIFIALLALPVATTAAFASVKTVTIMGVVSGKFQILTDEGQIYEIEDNGNADPLMELVNKKVKVKGTVGEIDGVKIISITSFEVVPP